MDITNENDVKGYYRHVRGVFLTKFLLALKMSVETDNPPAFESRKFSEEIFTEFQKQFPNEGEFLEGFRQNNPKIFLMFQIEHSDSAFLMSWIVFEYCTKYVRKPDYFLSDEGTDMNYKSGQFGFNEEEKKDLDLFYYIRNSIFHYNGKYFAYQSIDHSFEGKRFISIGNEGNQILSSVKMTYQMINKMEEYACKAIRNFNAFNAKKKAE